MHKLPRGGSSGVAAKRPKGPAGPWPSDEGEKEKVLAESRNGWRRGSGVNEAHSVETGTSHDWQAQPPPFYRGRDWGTAHVPEDRLRLNRDGNMGHPSRLLYRSFICRVDPQI